MPFLPKFEEVVQSEVWQEQIVPWLEDMYQTKIEDLLPEHRKEPWEYDYARGFCAALKLVLALPAQALELEKVNKQQGDQDEAVQSWRDTRRRSRSTF